MGRDAKGWAQKAAAIVAIPSLRAAESVATVAARMSLSDVAPAILSAISADTAAWSKIASAGQINPSGGEFSGLDFFLEAGAAKASWGLFKDDHLIVSDCRDSKAALV